MAAEKLITLEEAAERLEITPSMFRQKLQTDTMFKTISKIRDGSRFRFKPTDIEELRRSLGFGSEEELQMVDPSSDELTVPLELNLANDDAPKSTKAPSSKKQIAKPKDEDDDGAVLRLTEAELNLGDVFLMADEDGKPSKKSSSKLKPVRPKPDSDVSLGQSGKIKRPTVEEPSDEIELDILPRGGSSSKLAGSGRIKGMSSSKLPPPKSGKAPPPQKDDDSSEFELNLDPDSSDEFELSLADDSSDEISLGDLPSTTDGDSKAGLASGININRPRDAGVSLERNSKKIPAVNLDSGRISKKLPKPKDDDEVDFELSLDQPGASSKKLASSKNLSPSSKKIESQDSEFDLNLDDSVELTADDSDSFADVSLEAEEDDKKNDIFETDFEIPALDDDSASEAVAIDEADTDLESSDFDLAIDEGAEDDESGSEAIVLDDEIDEPVRKPGKKKRAVVEDDESDIEIDSDNVSFDEMDLDESVSASRALKGIKQGDVEPVIEERVVVLQTAPWGIMPAIFMLPTIFIVFIAGLMAYEMMHSMWGYHQPTKPASLVIDNVADILDMKPKDGQ